MATRFYLGNTVPDTSITPSMSGTWNVTTGFDRMLAGTVKDGTAMTTKTSAAVGAASPRVVGVRQFISRQLASQSLTGGALVDTAGLIRCAISSTASSSVGRLRIIIRVCSGDGNTIRGTMSDLEYGILGTFTTTLTTRGTEPASSATWTTVTAFDGDRLLIEVGWWYTSGTNTTRTADFSFGGNAASDLVAASGTTANNPWVEVPQNVLFYIPNKIVQVKQAVNRSNTY